MTGVDLLICSFRLWNISDQPLVDEEELTCNVCDRSFETPRQLERHQVNMVPPKIHTCGLALILRTILIHHIPIFIGGSNAA